jgi:glucose-1-phosphate cytidylyltransferase
MKVVLFCGGLGLRIRSASEDVPKPLMTVGGRPLLWHLMRYYAAHGHRDFVLCLGYRGEEIREYLRREAELPGSEAAGWRIEFVDTGLRSNIGERLGAVREYVRGEPSFLANYADGLTDLPLNRVIEAFETTDAVGCFVAVRSSYPGHLVEVDDDGAVLDIIGFPEADVRMNGGFFVFRQGIFDYLRPGEELVEQPFHRLIAERKLFAYRYDGFWMAMDTLKDKQRLEEIAANGAPWDVRERAPEPVLTGLA